MAKLTKQQQKAMMKHVKKAVVEGTQPQQITDLQAARKAGIVLESPIPLFSYHDPVPYDMCAPSSAAIAMPVMHLCVLLAPVVSDSGVNGTVK